MRELRLTKDLRRSIAAGHPWLYDGALASPGARLAPGEAVRVRDKTGPVAIGFADPDSPIRVRILARDPDVDLGGGWASDRARSAARLRRSSGALGDTDALRLIHGEGDFLPGLILDLYGDTAVVVFDGEAAAEFWRPRLGDLVAGLADGGYRIARVWRRHRGAAGEVLSGDPPPDAIEIHERGARFEVDVRRGQKTGLFLDQRDNRLYLKQLAGGARVLNLFGYTGGFSIQAAMGGARRVVTVDQARPAIAAAARNLARNRLDAARHQLVCEDAFAWLERSAAAGRRFDIVVCDPPSFAPNAQAVPAARVAYRRLNRLALDLVAPGGLLLTASCSSHFPRPLLREAVAGAALDAGRTVVVRSERGAAPDHPVLPAFPEGDYLALLDCFAA